MSIELRGDLPPARAAAVQVGGAAAALLLWHGVSAAGLVHPGILPAPLKVLASFGDLLGSGLPWNAWQSIKLNAMGYAEAVVICLPLGFVIGLFRTPKAMSERLLSALRFLPLPAALGVFIAAFGIGSGMKVHFLAAGITVYLLPTIVGRVGETPEVLDQTARTLGASRWQRIRHVFIPDVLARAFDDIRVLVAISWTYITIAEVVNSSAGGLGAMAELARRQSRVDKVYAVLVVVILIGWFQDWTFKRLDRALFPHKYA